MDRLLTGTKLIYMIGDKIITYTQAGELRRSTDKTIVLRTGCFDILHIGHIRTLEKDKKAADIVVVGVGKDSNIAFNKRKPLYDQYNRAYILASLSCVDYVVILDEESINNIDHTNLLSILKPDYWHIPTDDISVNYKKQLADRLGIRLLVVPLISVSNFGKVQEPHSSDIVKHEV